MNQKYFHVTVSTKDYKVGVNYLLTKNNIPSVLVLSQNKVAVMTGEPVLFANADVKAAPYKEYPVQEIKTVRKAKKENKTEETLP